MKIGDLVKIPDCPAPKLGKCHCFFCYNGSSNIGVITGHFIDNVKGSAAPYRIWNVYFDVGPWEIADREFNTGEAEILYEDR